jgi:predicted aspartyl protease
MATRRQALGGLSAAAGLGLWAGQAGAAGAEDVVIPFELTHDRAWTAVKFDGHGWYKLIVDTGAAQFCLEDALCKSIGLTRRSSNEMVGVSGVDYLNTYVAQVSIANVVNDQNAAVVGLGHKLDDGNQGLIPAAVLGNVLFDFVQKRMHLSHKAPSGLQGFSALDYISEESSGSMAHVRGASPYPTVHGELDGRPVKLHVDTGAPEYAFFFASYVERAGLWDKYKGAVDTKTGGVTSQLTASKFVKAETLKIGDVVFNAPHMTLQDPKEKVRQEYQGADGLIGIEALRRLDLALVPTEQRAYVRKNALFDDVERINRAGLFVRSIDEKPTVVSVYEGGPAWAAGIRKGDLIVGYAGGDGTIAGLDWKLSGPPGDQIDLEYSHEGQTKQVSFKLVEVK